MDVDNDFCDQTSVSIFNNDESQHNTIILESLSNVKVDEKQIEEAHKLHVNDELKSKLQVSESSSSFNLDRTSTSVVFESICLVRVDEKQTVEDPMQHTTNSEKSESQVSESSSSLKADGSSFSHFDDDKIQSKTIIPESMLRVKVDEMQIEEAPRQNAVNEKSETQVSESTSSLHPERTSTSVVSESISFVKVDEMQIEETPIQQAANETKRESHVSESSSSLNADRSNPSYFDTDKVQCINTVVPESMGSVKVDKMQTEVVPMYDTACAEKSKSHFSESNSSLKNDRSSPSLSPTDKIQCDSVASESIPQVKVNEMQSGEVCKQYANGEAKSESQVSDSASSLNTERTSHPHLYDDKIQCDSVVPASTPHAKVDEMQSKEVCKQHANDDKSVCVLSTSSQSLKTNQTSHLHLDDGKIHCDSVMSENITLAGVDERYIDEIPNQHANDDANSESLVSESSSVSKTHQLSPPHLEDANNQGSAISKSIQKLARVDERHSEDPRQHANHEAKSESQVSVSSLSSKTDHINPPLLDDNRIQCDSNSSESIPHSNVDELQSEEVPKQQAIDEAENGSQVLEGRSRSKPNFSILKGEICLDNFSIAELQEAFWAAFGRQTIVKDKLWLKRRIAMGLTNSCVIPDGIFIIKDKKFIQANVNEETSAKERAFDSEVRSISSDQPSAFVGDNHGDLKRRMSDLDETLDMPFSMRLQKVVTFKDNDPHVESTSSKRLRKPTRRYIEELSEIEETRESSEKPLFVNTRGHSSFFSKDFTTKDNGHFQNHYHEEASCMEHKCHYEGNALPAGEDGEFHMESISSKRSRKPTKRYIEELSEIGSGESITNPSSVKSCTYGCLSMKDSGKPAEDNSCCHADLTIRQKPVAGFNMQIPRVCRLRRGHRRRDLASVSKLFHVDAPSQNDLHDSEKVQDLSMHSPDDNIVNVPVQEYYPDDMDQFVDDSVNNSRNLAELKSINKPKQPRVWTLDEIMKLVKGVAAYGAGRWSEIKRLVFASSYRTPVDLKDKWRNLLRASSKLGPTDHTPRNLGKSSSIQIPMDVLLRVKELAEIHSQAAKGCGQIELSATSKAVEEKGDGLVMTDHL